MYKLSLFAAGLLLAQVAGAGTLPSPSAGAGALSAQFSDPGSLQKELTQGTWPADIVRAAEECLNRYRDSACAVEALRVRQGAAEAARVLTRKDVPLQRAAFATAGMPESLQADLHQAALGDAQAALRLADAYEEGGPLPANRWRQVAWLQFAAGLGDAEAAYRLALHYRSNEQPSVAAVYESRAVALGFVPPPVLDHIRK